MFFYKCYLFGLLGLLIYSCITKKYCKDGFDFTAEEYTSIPYLKDNALIFENEKGQKDTFTITTVRKHLTDYYDGIESGHHHYMGIVIRYTNKNFAEAIATDRTLFEIKKRCEDERLLYWGDWIDFPGLLFQVKPVETDSVVIRGKVQRNVLKFEADTSVNKDSDIQTVYWQNGKGVVMYRSKISGWWERIN